MSIHIQIMKEESNAKRKSAQGTDFGRNKDTGPNASEIRDVGGGEIEGSVNNLSMQYKTIKYAGVLSCLKEQCYKECSIHRESEVSNG